MTTPKTLSESPSITDQIKFELITTDADGNNANPYRVDKVVAYFLAREFTAARDHQLTTTISETLTIDTFFNRAQVIKVFGTPEFPAWLSTDLDNAMMERVGTGEFELLWTPEFAREGDYIVCWTWTPIIAGDKLSNFEAFFLRGDSAATTTLPSHVTDTTKYPTLLERYLPEHVKLHLSTTDLTPETLDTFNGALADGFVFLEDLVNQSVDLLDANAIHERLLLYLANNFNLILRSTDPVLWRRQIKSAVPLFKRKGTLIGIRQALAQAAITFNSWTQLWQIASPYTWQEAFTISDDQTEFELAKVVYDMTDFELYYRENGATTYTTLTPSTHAEIVYDSDDMIHLLRWKDTSPIELEDGDIIRVIYNLQAVVNPTWESYIRSLPLADQRDETEVTYPMKNWNVYLIEETDAMFDVLCPTRHPYQPAVIFGKVRTEFPYSENIYNMEEYNGSLRDSTDPCDLNKDFIDDCSCCISSKFNIDIEIEQLSTQRIEEAEEIIQEYKPFHAIIHQMSVSGGVNEFVPPQEEEVEMLISMRVDDTLVTTNDKFHRVIEDGLIDPTQVKRDALASVLATTVGTGTAKNSAIILYSLGVRFDKDLLAIDQTDNLLEILSGPDQGDYKVTNSQDMSVDIVQGAPDTIAYPLNESSFPFRLSNELFSGSVDSITQNDRFVFSDDNNDFRLSDVEAGWKIEVTAPAPLIGTYIINDSYPDDTLELASWATTSSSTGITYQLRTDADVAVGSASTTGEMTVTRRGTVDGGADFRIRYQVRQGDYLRIGGAGGTQYLIIQFVDDETFYIEGWTGGSVGVTAAEAYRRMLDNAVGYLGARGMVISTGVDYETALSISNGASALGPLLEDNQFKENFLILLDGNYYEMADISPTEVTIYGPQRTWGLTGVAKNFDFIQFDKEAKTVQAHAFSFIDRRNGDTYEIGTEYRTPMMFTASMLNKVNADQPLEYQTQSEGVSIEVEWKD